MVLPLAPCSLPPSAILDVDGCQHFLAPVPSRSASLGSLPLWPHDDAYRLLPTHCFISDFAISAYSCPLGANMGLVPGLLHLLHSLEQGSPTPGPWCGAGLCPVRNWAAEQEVSGGQGGMLHLCLQLRPVACITIWIPSPVTSEAAADSHTSTINVTCLNHPETIPLPPMEKFPVKLVPGAKKVEDWWLRTLLLMKWLRASPDALWKLSAPVNYDK